MKTNKILAFCSISAIALAFTFTGCKKDDPSNTDKLVDKDYKLTALTVDPAVNFNGTQVTDYYSAIIPSCSKDDIQRFAKNGTTTADEGAIKCDPADPQTTTGTWVWNTNETVLTLTDASGTQSYDVIKNDGSKLVLSFTQEDSGITYKFTGTYTKQ